MLRPCLCLSLLAFAVAGAFAANDPSRTSGESPADDGRTVAVGRPGNDAPASFTVRPPRAEAAGALGVPIDRRPIKEYLPPPHGPRQTIAGRCFVVTDGGQVMTLARVSIGVYPQREFSWYAQEIHARSRAHFQRVKSVACPENFTALSVPEMDRSLAAAAELQRDLHAVWRALPAASASTQTDEEGRFSVTHDVAPPFVVFAAGSRRVGDATEYYRWQIDSNLVRDPLQIELSNDALR